MKTNINPVTAKVSPTFIPVLVETDSEKIFGKDKNENGNNAPDKDKFMQVANFVLDNYETFELNTFLSLSRTFDTSPETIKTLFKKWTAHQLKVGRVELIQGCYDNEIFKVKFPRNASTNFQHDKSVV